MEKQIQNYKILGILFLCEFALTLLVFFLFILLFLFNTDIVLSSSGDASGYGWIVLMYVAIIAFYLVFMTPFGIGGWKLLKNRPGAKGWGIAASVLSLLFFFPLGIIIGVIGFILLFSNYNDNSIQIQNRQNHYPPPPKQDWR